MDKIKDLDICRRHCFFDDVIIKKRIYSDLQFLRNCNEIALYGFPWHVSDCFLVFMFKPALNFYWQNDLLPRKTFPEKRGFC